MQISKRSNKRSNNIYTFMGGGYTLYFHDVDNMGANNQIFNLMVQKIIENTIVDH